MLLQLKLLGTTLVHLPTSRPSPSSSLPLPKTSSASWPFRYFFTVKKKTKLDFLLEILIFLIFSLNLIRGRRERGWRGCWEWCRNLIMIQENLISVLYKLHHYWVSALHPHDPPNSSTRRPLLLLSHEFVFYLMEKLYGTEKRRWIKF